MQTKILDYYLNIYIKDFFLELIAPAHCAICGKKIYDNSFVCKECFSKIKINEYPLIFKEEMVYYYGMSAYEGVMKDLIHKFKFEHYKVLAETITTLLINFINKEKLTFDAISFVPMTRKELLERGYNQTYLIALKLAKTLNKTLIKDVFKVRETERQTNLSREERLKNLKDAFIVKGKYPFNILIIDDVYTTGATAREITKAFKNATDKKIFFVAIAQNIN